MENQNNKRNFLPWILGGLLTVALIALAVMLFGGKDIPPTVNVSDQNGVTTTTITSESVNAIIVSDQQQKQKQMYNALLEKEHQRTKDAETKLEEERKHNATANRSILKEISGGISTIHSDLEEIKEWQETINDNINTGFGNVNKGLASIDKNIIATREEVKKQHELTREEMKGIFKSIPRCLKDNADEDNDWPSGAKK